MTISDEQVCPGADEYARIVLVGVEGLTTSCEYCCATDLLVTEEIKVPRHEPVEDDDFDEYN